ncbi:MAG: hypothetical protein Q8P05_00805 [Candidatus Diapherotrites archaeon]|nr:hypothetical protein [Candidatus Diapherotrites archaeon]
MKTHKTRAKTRKKVKITRNTTTTKRRGVSKGKKFEDIFALAEEDYSPTLWGELEEAIRRSMKTAPARRPKKMVSRKVVRKRKTTTRRTAPKRR